MNFPDFSTLRSPGYRRTLAVRRFTAFLLVLAAIVSAFAGRAANDPVVLVFARDVRPGETLTPDDIDVRRLPETVIPDKALDTVDTAEGQVVASHAGAGEVVTSTRLLGPDLVAALAGGGDGAGFTMVPVKLAEPDIIPMLHHGDTVSVVTVDTQAPTAKPRTIATGGTVVLAGAQDEGGSPGSGVLLLLRDDDAVSVAAASLSSPLAVVLTSTNDS